MSKIGTEIIVGQIFKPIVTTFTYDELQNYRDNDISIGINNALIFSIPQQGLDNESSVDAYDNTSIWATDNSGLLCPLSFPYSMISKIKESLDKYEENTNAKKIVSVTWTKITGTSEAGTSPNINIKVEVKYANEKTSLLNITGIKVYKDPQFIEEYTTVIAGGETINWYDVAGIYYLQGLVTDTSTGSIMSTTNEYPLEWSITEIEKKNPKCQSNIQINYYENDNVKFYYAEINLSADVPGKFEIENLTEGCLLDNTECYITSTNLNTIFNLSNRTYEPLNASIKYRFYPDNTKYYNNISWTTIDIGNINGMPIESDYYIYIGLQRPTENTNPDDDLAMNNAPLYTGYGAAGWRSIGQTIEQYNAINPAFNGGQTTVILDINFNNIQSYIAIPSGMHIYDGLGNISNFTLYQSNITIKNRKYNIYTAVLEGEFGNLIY